jgi:hypothetical protein
LLYEAAALAVAEFKKSGFALVDVGPRTRITIAIEAPWMLDAAPGVAGA